MQYENNKNSKKLIKTTGEVISRHRKSRNKSIYKISAEASVSKAAWRETEIGACSDIKLTTLWKISEGLDIPLEKIIEEIHLELGSDFSLEDLK